MINVIICVLNIIIIIVIKSINIKKRRKLKNKIITILRILSKVREGGIHIL